MAELFAFIGVVLLGATTFYLPYWLGRRHARRAILMTLGRLQALDAQAAGNIARLAELEDELQRIQSRLAKGEGRDA